MYIISKEFRFEAAHRLLLNKDKCNNIHGHNYKVIMSLKKDTLNKEGMVLDFNKLKWFQDWLNDCLDHSIILNREDQDIINFCRQKEFKTFIINGDPTAENLLNILITQVQLFLDKLLKQHKLVTLDAITLYETDNCFATINF